MKAGSYGLVGAFLPLYAIFLDAAWTLATRIARGERVTEAHRSHLYQRLANGGYGHARVSLGYGITAIVGSAVMLAGGPTRSWLVGAYFLVVPAVGLRLHRRLTRGANAT
jgi:predicted MFS family arabinose efflux permease